MIQMTERLVAIHFDPAWLNTGPVELEPMPVVGVTVDGDGEPAALLLGEMDRLVMQTDLECLSDTPIRLTTPDTESVLRVLIRIISHHHLKAIFDRQELQRQQEKEKRKQRKQRIKA